jgi:hypothetical protein
LVWFPESKVQPILLHELPVLLGPFPPHVGVMLDSTRGVGQSNVDILVVGKKKKVVQSIPVKFRHFRFFLSYQFYGRSEENDAEQSSTSEALTPIRKRGPARRNNIKSQAKNHMRGYSFISGLVFSKL